MDRRFGFRTIRGHTFYGHLLGSKSTILDLGACIGTFSDRTARQYNCHAHAVEASPTLFARIEETQLVHKYHCAVSDRDGVEIFYESKKITAGTIIGPKINSTGIAIEVCSRSLPTLIAELELTTIDLLKIDIEGAEKRVFDCLQKRDLANVKQITIELHDSIRHPNISTEDARRVIARIRSMGFSGLPMGRQNMDWLFWNNNTVHLPIKVRTYMVIRKLLWQLLWR